MLTVDFHSVSVDGTHLGAQISQNIKDQRNITDLWNVFDPAGTIDEQCSGQDGHGGIFCAANGNLTVQRLAAINNIFLQRKTPL